MRILHCCLAAFYIDDFGYQENILPRVHKGQGHDVHIIASTETYLANRKLGYVSPRQYTSNDGISVTRIAYVNWLPHILAKKIRLYVGFEQKLREFRPDVVFVHDCQFLSILSLRSYFRTEGNVRIYIDTHTDFINSAKGWVSKNILHKILYRFCARSIEPYVTKFYATLPVRSTFLQEVYGIDSKKIELLPFGADDSVFNWDQRAEIRDSLRRDMGIASDDFVLITGGKIDVRKNIHFLLRAFKYVSDVVPSVKMILFGTPVEELKEEIEVSALHPNIRYIDWISAEEIHRYFFSADLAIFPGTHSVLWEEAVGLGVPCIVKKWEGITHIDLGGNCLFIETGNDVNEIKRILLFILQNPNIYADMKAAARDKGPKVFSYSQIAAYAISK